MFDKVNCRYSVAFHQQVVVYRINAAMGGGGSMHRNLALLHCNRDVHIAIHFMLCRGVVLSSALLYGIESPIQ